MAAVVEPKPWHAALGQRILSVSDPYPVEPCPDTPQYFGYQVNRYLNTPQPMPSEDIQYEGWVQADLRSSSDVWLEAESLYGKFVSPALHEKDWYLARIDGWLVTFKHVEDYVRELKMKREARMNPHVGVTHVGHGVSTHPERPHEAKHARFIDLRSFVGCEAELLPGRRGGCPYKVTVIHRIGNFGFNVGTEDEARDWKSFLCQAMGEHYNMEEEWRQRAREYTKDEMEADQMAVAVMSQGYREQKTAAGGQGHAFLSQYQPEVRMTGPRKQYTDRERCLRKLWARAVQAVSTGPVPDAIFLEIWKLYDANEDHSLDLEEFRALLLELIHVRKSAIEEALQKAYRRMDGSGQLDFGDEYALEAFQRDVVGPGEQLMDHYAAQMESRGGNSQAAHVGSAALLQKLDASHSGMVSVSDFMRRAPMLVMPVTELQAEARFFTALEVHDDEEEHQGCIQS